jgi:hypothetical protein
MTENDNRVDSENIRDQHHLQFWTESLSVTVSQDEGRITPKGMFGFNIHLDKARKYPQYWRFTVAEDRLREGVLGELELILLSKDPSRSTSLNLNIMLIEWHENVAYRIAIAKVIEAEWKVNEPKMKYIVLG